MQFNDNNKNRGAHGDSSFMLGGVPSSSENPSALSGGECQTKHFEKVTKEEFEKIKEENTRFFKEESNKNDENS